MIEAVNSVLSNASATRVVAEQQSAARSYAANPEKIQEAAQAPYVSPYISLDRQYNKAILQIRDSETGDVVRQYPTEGQLKAYRVAQQASQRSERAELFTPPSDTGTSVAKTSVSLPQISETASLPQATDSVPVTPSIQTEA